MGYIDTRILDFNQSKNYQLGFEGWILNFNQSKQKPIFNYKSANPKCTGSLSNLNKPVHLGSAPL